MSAGEGTPNYWRTSANGAVNVVWHLLQLTGQAMNYEDLLRHQRDIDPTGGQAPQVLIEMCAAHGLRLEPSFMTPEALRTAALPIVVHLDGTDPSTGSYQLLLARSETTLVYLNGPTSSINEMQWMDFERVWSGLVLSPGTQTEGSLGHAFLWLLGGLFGGVGLHGGSVLLTLLRNES